MYYQFILLRMQTYKRLFAKVLFFTQTSRNLPLVNEKHIVQQGFTSLEMATMIYASAPPYLICTMLSHAFVDSAIQQNR